MRLYDTALHAYAAFAPPPTVRVYVCGITPYDAAHLGHILTFMTYDLLQRRLEDDGHEVRMVRNVTDVDEPIYIKAVELGVPYTQLAAEETAAFDSVMERLNFQPLAAAPRASDYIDQIATAVEMIKLKGLAYQVGQDWYFDTAALAQSGPAYGDFSGLSERLLRGLLAERGGDPERPGKRSPLDFLLWKSVTDPADPAAWDSTLGRGRPGWHIECTVMSRELLKLPFDLHGGGSDLIFPHHESEIAQARALGFKEAASMWVHVSPLLLHGEKMSKSLGNLIFARDLLETYEPSVIRLALMFYHYRTGGEWRPEFLADARQLLEAVRNRLAGASSASVERLTAEIRDCLDDDLDTPEIVCHLRRFTAAENVKPAAAEASPADIARLDSLLGLTLGPSRP